MPNLNLGKAEGGILNRDSVDRKENDHETKDK
jgi:hypothetical protein